MNYRGPINWQLSWTDMWIQQRDICIKQAQYSKTQKHNFNRQWLNVIKMKMNSLPCENNLRPKWQIKLSW